MIYVVINNEYQLSDIELHLSLLNRSDVALIRIPHTLSVDAKYPFFKTLTFKRVCGYGFVRTLLVAYLGRRSVDRNVRPAQCDTCIVYTEYEFLNQYVVSKFKKAGAKVIMIEDGGFATYLPFRMSASEQVGTCLSLKQWAIRRALCVPGLRFIRINEITFHWMPDEWIDAICLYRPVPLTRAVRQLLLQKPEQSQALVSRNVAIFLNEAMYDRYLQENVYLSALRKILEAMCARFERVLFKFHPRESVAWRKRITSEVLAEFPAVKLVQENDGVERIIDRYQAGIAASFFSAGLFNLLERGVEPMYLYHLIPELACKPIFIEVGRILDLMGYNFIKSLSEMSPEFCSGMGGQMKARSAITLKQVLAASTDYKVDKNTLQGENYAS